jgi:16S rRNA (adenine1518-N6/adenine1519-N6)-dimethyltransferase
MTTKAKKSLGQHWLEDGRILEEICEIADVNPGDTVLEIGPGHGSLTRVLLAKGAYVVAVELDEELAADLANDIKSEHLKIVTRDILKFNLNELPKDYKVVANIPYYLTSNLIRTLSEAKNPPKSITLLVQKEVAERICAKPGSMSLLSVSAQIYYECALGPVVTADKFIPPPKVDSQVVNMLLRSKPQVDRAGRKDFFRVVRAGFSNRRKTLENSLSGGLRIAKKEITGALIGADTSTNTRAQELSITQWLELVKYLTR